VPSCLVHHIQRRKEGRTEHHRGEQEREQPERRLSLLTSVLWTGASSRQSMQGRSRTVGGALPFCATVGVRRRVLAATADLPACR
jgi:hypothetical protein